MCVSINMNRGNECEIHCCLFLNSSSAAASSSSSEIRPDQRALPVGEIQPVRAAGGAQDGHGWLPAHPEPPGSLRRGALHAAGPRHGQVSWVCKHWDLLCQRRLVVKVCSSPTVAFTALLTTLYHFLWKAVTGLFQNSLRSSDLRVCEMYQKMQVCVL